MDFLEYWDTRIEANKRLFDKSPDIANFTHDECEMLFDLMAKEHRARYNALREAVAWEREAETAWYSDSLPLTARALYELHENFTAARAEVSRLLESAP